MSSIIISETVGSRGMFQLLDILDSVKLHPSCLRSHFSLAIMEELNYKYANKVLHDVGLCVAVFDLLEIFDAFVYQGDGSPFIKVHFRAIIFRPFIGEVVVGKIRACTEQGVHVSVKFFDDILIAPVNLQPDSYL